MTYEVEISPAATAEIDAAYAWLLERTPQHAPEWYNRALDAMLSLADNPARCPFDDRAADTHKLLFGDKRHAYRIIFRIRGNTVHVLHVRHGARGD